MIEQGSLSLALATSNARKLEQFRRQVPGVDAVAIPVLFDEERIKKEIGIPETEGFRYVAEISRAKFDEQRKKMRVEEVDGDHAIVVSDSVVMIEENGGFTSVNRDGLTEERKREVLDAINRARSIRYVGSVTFGRKKGESSFTVLSYLDIPLEKPAESFPVEVADLPTMVDPQKGFTAGFVEFARTQKGVYFPHFKPTQQSQYDFQAVRPHISGLTAQTLQLANVAGKLDMQTASLLENIVEQRPFNTLSFYAEYLRSGKGDVLEFYKEIVAKRKEIYDTVGGNCSLHTLRLADALQERGFNNIQVVVFASNKPAYKKGHSGILLEQEGVKFLFDPGMTIPFVVPISGDVPLYPIKAGEKAVLSMISDANADGIPDLNIYKSKGTKTIQLFGQEIISPQEFENELPQILHDLHFIRSVGKIDFHDKAGIKILGILFDFKKKSVDVRVGEADTKKFVVDLLLTAGTQERNEFAEICRQSSIAPEAILSSIADAELAT